MIAPPAEHGARMHRTSGIGVGTFVICLRSGLGSTVRDVNVRNLSTLLWFAAGWSGSGLIVGFLGLPTSWALLGGLVAAAIVRWEPTGRLWGASGVRRVRPIDEVAAELDAQGGTAASAAGDRSRI